MSIDTFFNRTFHPVKYNCVHFVREVWQYLTSEDISEKFGMLLLPPSDRRIEGRRLIASMPWLDYPASPCFALMQRRRVAPHLGVYLDGRILHIHELGVEFQPIDVASRGFQTVRFFR